MRTLREMFGLDDPHIACKTTIRSLEQQRDSAIAMMNVSAAAYSGMSEVNLKLTEEIVRLSQRNVPDYGDSALDPLPSTLENDQVAAVVLRDPERLRRPEPGPMRVDG